jgi:hypothetical protein
MGIDAETQGKHFRSTLPYEPAAAAGKEATHVEH